ncbi:MAG: hypothetical protein Q8S92_21315 [Hydrogenophaga sp.]|uniref:hypothetical protein n=1 Tax=Hydrogenophaga sp. TaxID=1904254 RepID=UPI00273437AA|nr:hypothetical protein [Hydrogenophaga sp.]MDP3351536.1 hypothetical protein [Hydrogenophaga sp.]
MASTKWVSSNTAVVNSGWPERYTVIGAGKTTLETCVCLLSQGESASAIPWVRLREGWRRFKQPEDGLLHLFAGVGLYLKAMAQGTSVDDAFARHEADGFFMRVDTRGWCAP